MRKMWRKAGAACALGATLAVLALGAAVIPGPLRNFMNEPIGKIVSGLFPAQADVIWEPEDPFYMEKSWDEDRRDEFVHQDRNYFVNQEQGYLYVVDDPENQNITDGLENGTLVYVSFTYTDSDGVNWGVIQYQRTADGDVTPNYGAPGEDGAEVMTGWIRMEDVSLVYDSEAFMEEHRDELELASGQEKVNLEEGEEMQCWTYPGSGSTSGTIPSVDDNLHVDYLYTDQDGREWGHIVYYYGVRDVWISLTDPTATDLPVHAGKTDEILPLKTLPQELPATMAEALGEENAASGLSLWLTVLGLVALSVGASGAIIWYFHLHKTGE